jgi:quercetin dioxygenase-like cupin family protein
MSSREFWRKSDDGDNLWVMGGLYTVKARGSETGDAYSLFEVQGPAASPRHMHDREEEAFFVVEGAVTLAIGGEMIDGTAGTFAFVPRGVEHAFTLASPDAKLLLLISPGNAGHEDLFAGIGEPAPAHIIPPPSSAVPDFERLAAIAASYGTTIVGPPIGVHG